MAATAVVFAAATAMLATGPRSARAATLSTNGAGHEDVIVNDYGTERLGTFRLDVGDDVVVALCLDAHLAHDDRADAYRPAANRIESAPLDALLWHLAGLEHVDDDTATAAAALAWHYAGARRDIGPSVWSDGAREFAAIGPRAPHRWDALPRFSGSFPVGLRSGATDLDEAERRVLELHERATAQRGPWRVEAAERPGRFVVIGPGGPIAGTEVEVVVRPTAGAAIRHVRRTDADGAVSVELPELPDGGTVTAAVEAPGIHREWDAGGRAQRMATATSDVIEQEIELAPLTRHLVLTKRSADRTIAPAGARFELRDAAGAVVERGRTDAQGVLRFSPVEPDRHPAPYELVETVAPPGLAVAPPRRIDRLSHRRDDPTIVEVIDEPERLEVVVRKLLSVDAAGPDDRSGFGFSITRREDGLVHHLTTGPDGSTDAVRVASGTWTVCEHTTPSWASDAVDTGCRTVTIEAAADAEPITVDYLNELPVPTIDTSVRDPVDGDRTLPHTGGEVLDEVHLSGLVPGTDYRLEGAILTIAGDPVTTATTMFTATATTAELEMPFDLPASPPGAYVAVQALAVEDRVVARHDALDDPDQTILVRAPTSTTAPPSTTSTSTSTSTTPPPAPTVRDDRPAEPRPVESVWTPPSTLPATGTGVTTLLRIGDVIFVIGVVAVLLGAVAPGRGRRAV